MSVGRPCGKKGKNLTPVKTGNPRKVKSKNPAHSREGKRCEIKKGGKVWRALEHMGKELESKKVEAKLELKKIEKKSKNREGG